jgi:beta-galactosidase GanA
MLEGYIKLYKEWFKDVITAEKVFETPENVSVTMRCSSDYNYVFVMNFNNQAKKVNLPIGYEIISGNLKESTIDPYGVVVLKKAFNG